MNVVCIFPITDNSERYFEILTIFKEKIVPQLAILGAEAIEIKFAGTDYVFVPTNQVKSQYGKQKGEGILECLKNCGNRPDCVIVCDGSGAIPYTYIIDLYQELVSDLSICGVLANRIKNKGITDERFLIEQFEIFALKKLYNYNANIPDGQCGLWGYKTGDYCINGCNISGIKLTAKSYEVELDLLSELLQKKLKFSFIDVELPPRTSSSSFKFENNITKMKFLLEKYPELNDRLLTLIKEFELTDDFISKASILSVKNIWDEYKKSIINLLSQ